MENMPLWHERDISHSSVERVIAPDSTILIDYMLHRLTGILRGLVVHADRMDENLKKMKGLIFSQQLLLRLAGKGLERQAAYVMVQRNAMKVWETGQEFKNLIMEDQGIGGYLSKTEIEEIFDLDYHVKHVDDIYERVF
jgi:adenylosuccinate lyase